MRRTLGTTAALAATLAFAMPAAAQQQTWTQADEDRSTILRFLERDDVGAVAEGMGVDVQDAGRAVLELNATEAAAVANQLRDAEDEMAADTITMTTTTLIIILLVIILLVLIL